MKRKESEAWELFLERKQRMTRDNLNVVFYCRFLKTTLRDNGIKTLLFTSDTPTLTADWGNIDYELMTINFKWGSEGELARIKEIRQGELEGGRNCFWH